jgi:hypothetical protein
LRHAHVRCSFVSRLIARTNIYKFGKVGGVAVSAGCSRLHHTL